MSTTTAGLSYQQTGLSHILPCLTGFLWPAKPINSLELRSVCEPSVPGLMLPLSVYKTAVATWCICKLKSYHSSESWVMKRRQISMSNQNEGLPLALIEPNQSFRIIDSCDDAERCSVASSWAKHEHITFTIDFTFFLVLLRGGRDNGPANKRQEQQPFRRVDWCSRNNSFNCYDFIFGIAFWSVVLHAREAAVAHE